MSVEDGKSSSWPTGWGSRFCTVANSSWQYHHTGRIVVAVYFLSPNSIHIWIWHRRIGRVALSTFPSASEALVGSSQKSDVSRPILFLSERTALGGAFAFLNRFSTRTDRLIIRDVRILTRIVLAKEVFFFQWSVGIWPTFAREPNRSQVDTTWGH